MRPALQQLCARKVAADLVHYGDELQLLPSDLQILVANTVLERRPKPNLNELQILCQTVWKPTRLCLTGVPSLNVRGLEKLTYLSSLLKLDLSGCGWWLHELSFLPGLMRLQCLNLRDCWFLSGDCLAFIQQLPQLRCLDLEYVYMITDAWASYFIPGMRNLRALNMSGTGISDRFLEALTYGGRLQSWAAEQNFNADSADGPIGIGLGQYPALDIIFLRLQHTKVTEQAVHWLSSLKRLMLLDVRSSELTGRSLYNIKGTQGLIALPNNSKLLGKTNSILLSVVKGACGCSSKVIEVGGDDKDKPIWLKNWEENSLVKFLQEASLFQNVPP